jgi:hypothetical protein
MMRDRPIRVRPTPFRLDDAYKANAIRERLSAILHDCPTLALAREGIVRLLCDISEDNNLTPTAEETLAPTLRSMPDFAFDVDVDWGEESASATESSSQVGLEYGP